LTVGALHRNVPFILPKPKKLASFKLASSSTA
jgi:hypothetical protein